MRQFLDILNMFLEFIRIQCTYLLKLFGKMVFYVFEQEILDSETSHPFKLTLGLLIEGIFKSTDKNLVK